MSLFIGYATSANSDAWYVVVLFYGSIICATLFIITGLLYIIPLFKNRLNPIELVGEVRCTYWPLEKQILVMTFFKNHSPINTFRTLCSLRSGEQEVTVNERVSIGGTYFNERESVLKSGQSQPIMVEFRKNNIELNQVGLATIQISMKPNRKFWRTKKRTEEVTIGMVNHSTQQEI